MKGKKGQNLSITTVIITILAIFVLVLVVVALTGGFGNFVKWWNGVFAGSALSSQEAVLKCNGYCESYEVTGENSFKANYCTKKFSLDTDGDGKPDLHDLTCEGLNTVTCAAIPSCITPVAPFDPF